MPKVAEAAWNSRKAFESSLVVAQKFGLALAAYEAGLQFVGHSGANNQDQLTELFHAASGHSAMRQIFSDDLTWKEAGGGPMCLFASISEEAKRGSGGLKEWPDDPMTKAMKFAAVRQFESTAGRWWSIGRKPSNS